MIWLLLLTISTYIVLTSDGAVWVVSSKTEQWIFSIFFIIGLIGWIRFEKIKTQIPKELWIEKRGNWLVLILLSAYVFLTSDIIKVSMDTELWFFILSIIGFIGWVKYANRKAEEGGNWLSNKPSVDDILTKDNEILKQDTETNSLANKVRIAKELAANRDII